MVNGVPWVLTVGTTPLEVPQLQPRPHLSPPYSLTYSLGALPGHRKSAATIKAQGHPLVLHGLWKRVRSSVTREEHTHMTGAIGLDNRNV